MIYSLWYYFLYLYGLFLDSLSACDNNNRLSTSRINKTQYLGQWYFIAAAAMPGTRALEVFTAMDNAEFSVRQCREEDKLDFRAAIRVKNGSCVHRKWIYLLPEGSTELRTKGHPDRLTQLFPPRCTHCVILKETDISYTRLLLYSRSPQLEEDFMEEFKSTSNCEGYTDILMIPHQQDYCQIED